MFDHELPGHQLTSNELRMEELDQRPSLRLIEPAARRAPAVTGTPGPDRPLSAPRTTRPGVTSPSSAPGHNFPEAA